MTFGKISGRLFTFIALFTMITAFAADFTESHVFNPRRSRSSYKNMSHPEF